MYYSPTNVTRFEVPINIETDPHYHDTSSHYQETKQRLYDVKLGKREYDSIFYFQVCKKYGLKVDYLQYLNELFQLNMLFIINLQFVGS